MIQIETLGKTYGGRARTVRALHDVSLAIGPGVTAVVGPNGAGKTTLLGLMLGFLRPTAGSVRIDGRPPRRYLRRHGAGYLPERFRLPPEWPAGAALRALARLEGLSGAEADGRAGDALDRLGLGEHASRPVGVLSRGLNQRLGLAQALLADRPLTVLDEPTEGLDPLWRVRFREIVHDLRQRGRTLVLASHELAEVERVADRAVLLDRGRLREVIELAAPEPGPARYRLLADGPPSALRTAFPGAAPDHAAAGEPAPRPSGAVAPDDAGTPGAGEPAAVVVTVADARELSHRLAAFLDAGGVVRAVVPLDGDLETRVRRRLEES